MDLHAVGIEDCCCLDVEFSNMHTQERGKPGNVIAFFCLVGPTRGALFA
jgi:hypothetical protein